MIVGIIHFSLCASLDRTIGLLMRCSHLQQHYQRDEDNRTNTLDVILNNTISSLMGLNNTGCHIPLTVDDVLFYTTFSLNDVPALILLQQHNSRLSTSLHPQLTLC